MSTDKLFSILTLVSRGPGRVERAIEALFDAERDNAFTLEELCERIYGVHRVKDPELSDPKRLRPSHRNAMTAAAHRVAARRPEIQIERSGGLGGALVFFRHDEVMSYAMARLKADNPQPIPQQRSALVLDPVDEQDLAKEACR